MMDLSRMFICAGVIGLTVGCSGVTDVVAPDPDAEEDMILVISTDPTRPPPAPECDWGNCPDGGEDGG